MVMRNEGNGHDPAEIAEDAAFRGATLKLEELKRADGILTAPQLGSQGGVLHRAMTAEDDDKNYRQELKTGIFLSVREEENVAAAIQEALRYGCSLTPIIDWVIARSAGVNGGRLKAIFETLSHTTITANYNGDKKKWSSNDRKPKSPLS